MIMEDVRNIAAGKASDSSKPAVKSLPINNGDEKAQASTPLGNLGKLPLEIREQIYGYLTGTLHCRLMNTDPPASGNFERESDELSKIMRLSGALREELNNFWRSQGILAIYAHGGAISYPLGVTGSLLETVLQAPNLHLTFGIESSRTMTVGTQDHWLQSLTAGFYGCTLLADLLPLILPLSNQRCCHITIYLPSSDKINSEMWSQGFWGSSAFVHICRELCGYDQLTVYLRYNLINSPSKQVDPRRMHMLFEDHRTLGNHEENIESLTKRILEVAIHRVILVALNLNADLESLFGPAIAVIHQAVESDHEFVLSYRPKRHKFANTTS